MKLRLLLFLLPALVACGTFNRDNPFDPKGTNYTIPVVVAMQDTTVSVGDSFYIHATGSETNGTIKKYLWALGGANYRDSTNNGRIKTAFGTVGEKKVLVKVRDGDGMISQPDSCVVTVVSNAVPVAPSIITQPQSQTVTAGRGVTFSVTATGTAPLFYQWFKNNAAIPGAISSSYSLSNVQSANAGTYKVTVSNGTLPNATSTGAVLTVSAAPVAPGIITQPQSQTVTAGQNVTFSVTAAGTTPLSYQWYKNGVIISGATSSSYTLSNVQAANAGTYTVTVSNGTLPNATSSGAVLTVNAVNPVCTVVPYTGDANTVLLDHFNSSTSATFNAYIGSSGCGSWTAATSIHAYATGPGGLGPAMMMSPPAGQPAGSASYLRYSTQDILCLASGTIEFWVYPTAYGHSPLDLAGQGQYYNACNGWTFRMGIDTSGHLTSSDWDYTGSFSMTSSQVVALNVWSHVAVTWGSAGAKLYLNGVQVGSHSSVDHPASGFGGYLMMCCGTNAGVGCAIDELRISSVQRTSFNLCAQQ
jgi:hypothetical protein